MMSLDAVETARRLPYSELVPEIARAARELRAGELLVPERLIVPVGSGATLLCMPAAASEIGITKIVTVHPQNASLGLPTIQGEVIVFRASTGERLLILDGPTVTARRTAAVSMLAIEKLKSTPPRRAAIIGTGVQAAAHVEALIEYFAVGSLWIVGRRQEAAADACRKARSRYPNVEAVPVTTEGPARSLPPADVVIALTTSKTPVIPEDVPDDTLVIGVGAFRPDMAELPPGLLRRRRVVVDNLKGAEREAGDLLQAQVNWSHVSELVDQLDRCAAGDSASYAFKSVGHASWDVAAARVAMRSE